MSTDEFQARMEAKRAQAKYFRDLERAAYVSTLKKTVKAPKPRRTKTKITRSSTSPTTQGNKGQTRYDGTLICAGTCGRPLRNTRSLLADLPGSVKVHTDDKCKGCLAAERPAKVREVKTCGGCDKTLRPSGTALEQYPGTVVHGGRGLCHACRKRMLPDGTIRPPAHRRIAHDGTTQCIDCERTLRTSATKVADAPGTVPVRFHLPEGYVCLGCAKKRART